MMRSTARIDSERADRYLVQLCKHFAHKVPAAFDQASSTLMQGKVDFPWGTCRLASEKCRLEMTCEAADAESLRRIESVVADHVERFAWREKPRLDWQED